jgi:hypothetical protein
VTDEQDPDRGIPPSVSLRWPILVVLDEMGEEDAILEFQEPVADHLNLPDDAGDVVDPDTGRSLLTERLLQAIADLYQAGAVDGRGDGDSLWITDEGRRLTENDVQELVIGDAEAPDPSAPAEDKPSVGSWIATLLETFLP